jgi:hypothetical protein
MLEVSGISKQFYLNRSGMITFLKELEESPDASAVSIYIKPGMALPEIESLLLNIKVVLLYGELIQTVADSKNGTVLFWGIEKKYLVFPPFPLKDTVIFSGYITEPLRLLLGNDFNIGLVLVHLGTYAIGICRGDKLISSKVGTGLVHGRHKQGGSSQARFQRRRQNQARDFLKRVCTHVLEQFNPLKNSLDYIVYGGPRHTVLQLQKMCPFLKSFEDRTLEVIEVPSLRQRVLEAAVSRVWSSRIIELQEE